MIFAQEVIQSTSAGGRQRDAASQRRRACQQARGRARGNEGSAQVKLPDDGGDAGRRGGDAGALKFQGGSVTDGEGDRQDGGRSVISRSGATGVVVLASLRRGHFFCHQVSLFCI